MHERPIKPYKARVDGWTMGLTWLISNHKAVYYRVKGTPSLYYWLLLALSYTPDSYSYDWVAYFVHSSTCWRCIKKTSNEDPQTAVPQKRLIWSGKELLSFVDCNQPEPEYRILRSNLSLLNRHDQGALPPPVVEVTETSTAPFDSTSQHITNYRHLVGIGESVSLDPGVAVGERREPISTSFLTDRSRKLA